MKQHRSERPTHPATTLLAIAALLTGAPTGARADSSPRQPLWELGLGAAALRLPDYRGADVAHGYLLPLPYVIYRGNWLRAGRDGARAVLIETPTWVLDISLHASVPVRSHDNPARQGMANLPATVEIGPQLSTTLWRAASGPAHLDLRLPLRSAITLERSPSTVGQVFTPNLNLDLPHVTAGWNLGLQAGLSYGSRRHHEHFYGVSAADATAARPAYQARGGYAGWQTLAALSRRYDQTWVGLFMRYDRLDGAVFADSPLVRQRDALSAGIAFAWVLARSTQEARSDD
ncbi:MAG: MipA/OmpV family protein [Leptothrix sp. (in: b-proteobacteria)]